MLRQMAEGPNLDPELFKMPCIFLVTLGFNIT